MDAVSTFSSAAEVAGLSGAELDRALDAVERARRELEAAYVAVLDRADDTHRFSADGHAGVRGWASALTNTGSVELHRRLQTMRALRDLPDVASALARGEIGVDQVREVARLHANPRTREPTVEGQTKLVRHARTKAFVEFAEIVGRWDAFGDPDRPERRHRDAHERRDAIVFEKDGVVHLHAKGGTFQSAALMEIFQRQCDAEFLDDWEHAGDSRRHRRQALRDRHRYTDRPVRRRHGVTHRLVPSCDRRLRRRGSTSDANAGTPGSARVAVILARRRCLWPGCGRASTRNQIDHTHEHSRGGRTSPCNGGPACGRHNRTKNRGYTVHRDTDGNWHVHRPDGTELTEPAAA